MKTKRLDHAVDGAMELLAKESVAAGSLYIESPREVWAST